MINYLWKSTFRSIVKNKTYAFINVLGISVGMTVCLFIGLYIFNEESYDSFHINKANIYRVRHDRYTNGELTRQWTAGAAGIGQELKNSFPEVVNTVRLRKENSLLSRNEILFKEERTFFASEDFFKMFSFHLLEGSDSLVLRDPFSIVISQSLANRYFGNQDPIGKTLLNNGKDEYLVTGVFQDVPENSHLKFDALFSFSSYEKILDADLVPSLNELWIDGFYTYIQLRPGTDFKTFEAKIPALVQQKVGNDLKESNEGMAFILQPLTSIHLQSNFKDELEANGSGTVNSFLILSAICILIMAWINYISLTIGRSVERAREVGLRKVLGSNRFQLLKQFMFESFVIKAIAVSTSILLVCILLPYFSTLVNKHYDLSVFRLWSTWSIILVISASSFACAGLYPAMLISGFNPVNVLKGKLPSTSKGSFFRKGLVMIQFVSSLILVISTSVIYNQIQFVRNGSLGVELDQVLVVHGPNSKKDSHISNLHTFRQEVAQFPGVLNVSASSDVPGHNVIASQGGIHLVKKDERTGNSFRVVMTDEDLLKTFGLELISGRNFSPQFNEDWKSALINETALKLLGFTEPAQAIGEQIVVFGSTLEIVGVLKDYHQESLKKKVDQLIFVCDHEVSDYISVKVAGGNSMEDIVKLAELKYKMIFPGNVFQHFFADDYYDQQYRSDQQLSNIVMLFTGIAISIACLGLFGLSYLTIVQRTKEIGIRKVIGASVRSIVALVSRDFLVVVLVANILAWPAAYFILDGWLGGFANRISLGLLTFLIPSNIVMFMALITVMIQSIKAALANPVDSIRID